MQPALPNVLALNMSLRSFWDLPVLNLDLVFDAVRPWGSLRELNLTRVGRYWTCRAQFWFEDEAQKFELEVPKNEFLGWDV
jgi:hypothetical protein